MVYWMMVPSAALWTVDIIFRMESKGASPTRGHAAFSSGFKRPFLAASLTRAHSVGSPMAWPASASHSESEQRAMAVSSSFSSSVTWSTTVIRFWVSVPVLSEQMIWVQPKVSTAVSLRMMAFRLDILVTPMESTMVTTAARPSGIAATARDTATIKEFKMELPLKPERMRPTAKITAQMPSTSTVRILLSWFNFNWRGVSSSLAWARAEAILPISVSMPVPVRTAFPRPYTTVEPM